VFLKENDEGAVQVQERHSFNLLKKEITCHVT